VSILSLGGVNNTKYVYALLRELDIPHSWVFDKDFFLDYKNNNIKDRSRNRYGFFQYTVSLTTNENKKKLIELLIPNKPDRDRIITLLHNNHTKASELLNKYNIICMRYNLEMDMCSSIASQMFLYNKLGIPANKQSINTLLTEYKEKIKDAIIVHETISQLSKKNLPTSFQTIIRLIKTIA